MKQHGTSGPHWSVPIAVAEIPEAGKHVELVADEATRFTIAKALGLVDMPHLEATFDLTQQATGGIRVVGRVWATIVQTCVVTLDPVENAIEESVDLLFAPQPAAVPGAEGAFTSSQIEEPPEVLREGQVDLGAVALEFLILGIDPYPRKPGVRFDTKPVVGDAKARPFAVLADLKKQLVDKGG